MITLAAWTRIGYRGRHLLSLSRPTRIRDPDPSAAVLGRLTGLQTSRERDNLVRILMSLPAGSNAAFLVVIGGFAVVGGS